MRKNGRIKFILNSKNLKKIIILCVGGLFAGICNGLLGAGGGVVIVSVLAAVLPDDEESRRSLYANALCVMLPLSLLTLATYGLRGNIPSEFMNESYAPILLGAAVGGVVGALLLDRLSSKILRMLFGGLTVISGLLMLVP